MDSHFNKYKWTTARLKEIGKNPKHPLRKKLGLTSLFGNVVYKGKDKIVPSEDVPDLLKKMIMESGMPLGINSAYQYIRSKNLAGISRRMIQKYFKSLECYQLLQRRKFNKDKKFDVTRGVLRGGKVRIGIDLIQLGTNKSYLPGLFGKAKYILVVVERATGYVWAAICLSKTQNHVNDVWVEKILPDLKKRIKTKDYTIESDRGKEWNLMKKNFPHWYFMSKSAVVEKMNSNLQYYMSILNAGFKSKLKLPALLKLAVKKVNNIKSTRIKTTAVKAMEENDRERLYAVRKKTARGKFEKPSLQTKIRKGHYVRHAIHTEKTDQFYKRFVGLKPNSKFKGHWSKSIYKVEAVKRFGGSVKFMANKRWFFKHQLLPVVGPTAVVFKKEKKAKKKKSPKKNGKPKKKKKVIPLARGARGTRIRKKPVRFGFS